MRIGKRKKKIAIMSWKTKYSCVGCGYETDVYEGKGFFNQHITMMSCPECHTIQPLTVGGVIGDIAPSFNSEAGRLCLRCGSKEIRIWDMKTCPKCGCEMTDVGPREFWT